jgi:Protein of unknown function (DUF1353)
MREFHRVLAVAVFCGLFLHCSVTYAQGTFTGRVAVEWLTGQSPERDMKLLEPFTFTDAAGKAWHVPAGTVVNGASIPKGFWTLVGSPYTGNYRRASVVHDHYCYTKDEKWQDVHRMFYHAMVSGGVDALEAKVLYAFVYAGGPRWDLVVTTNLEGTEERLVVPLSATISDQAQREINAWIQSTNPSLEDIDKRLDANVIVR